MHSCILKGGWKERHCNLLLFPAWQPKQLDLIKRLQSCGNYTLKEKISNYLSLIKLWQPKKSNPKIKMCLKVAILQSAS